MNFLSGVQFGNLKPKDTVPPLPKAKLSKRAYLWCGIQIVGPPVTYFVRLRQGTPDALWGCGNGQFSDNSRHRCSSLFYMVWLVFFRKVATSCTFSLSKRHPPLNN